MVELCGSESGESAHGEAGTSSLDLGDFASAEGIIIISKIGNVPGETTVGSDVNIAVVLFEDSVKLVGFGDDSVDVNVDKLSVHFENNIDPFVHGNIGDSDLFSDDGVCVDKNDKSVGIGSEIDTGGVVGEVKSHSIGIIIIRG